MSTEIEHVKRIKNNFEDRWNEILDAVRLLNTRLTVANAQLIKMGFPPIVFSLNDLTKASTELRMPEESLIVETHFEDGTIDESS